MKKKLGFGKKTKKKDVLSGVKIIIGSEIEPDTILGEIQVGDMDFEGKTFLFVEGKLLDTTPETLHNDFIDELFESGKWKRGEKEYFSGRYFSGRYGKVKWLKLPKDNFLRALDNKTIVTMWDEMEKSDLKKMLRKIPVKIDEVHMPEEY